MGIWERVVPLGWWWQRYRKFFQLALAVILLITAISLFNREKDRLFLPETALRSALAPVQGFVQGVSDRFKGMLAGIVELQELREENQRLREELERREFVYSLLLEVRAENTRLLKLINFKETIPQYDTLAARIIAREPGNWYNTVTINKGTRDGVQVNMPVITHGGLVGRVSSVTIRQAEVLLLLDQRSAVGGMLQRTREMGIVRGFAGEEETLRMIYLPRDAEVQIGDNVVTSGLGGIFPKGLLIGTVAEVKTEEYGLAQYAVIEAAADFEHLEEVLVILSSQDEGAAGGEAGEEPEE